MKGLDHTGPSINQGCPDNPCVDIREYEISSMVALEPTGDTPIFAMPSSIQILPVKLQDCVKRTKPLVYKRISRCGCKNFSDFFGFSMIFHEMSMIFWKMKAKKAKILLFTKRFASKI